MKKEYYMKFGGGGDVAKATSEFLGLAAFDRPSRKKNPLDLGALPLSCAETIFNRFGGAYDSAEDVIKKMEAGGREALASRDIKSGLAAAAVKGGFTYSKSLKASKKLAEDLKEGVKLTEEVITNSLEVMGGFKKQVTTEFVEGLNATLEVVGEACTIASSVVQPLGGFRAAFEVEKCLAGEAPAREFLQGFALDSGSILEGALGLDSFDDLLQKASLKAMEELTSSPMKFGKSAVNQLLQNTPEKGLVEGFEKLLSEAPSYAAFGWSYLDSLLDSTQELALKPVNAVITKGEGFVRGVSEAASSSISSTLRGFSGKLKTGSQNLERGLERGNEGLNVLKILNKTIEDML